MECRLWDEICGLIGEGFENGAGAVRTVFEQDGERVFHRGEAVVVLAGVAVDAIEKRGEIDELVTHFDELEIEKILLARHGWKIGGHETLVNGEDGADWRHD